MGRILAIDYGTKRTGLAVTDPLRIIAGGLETVPTHTLPAWFERYFAAQQVDIIVIGKALRMDGTPSESMTHIEPFVERLRAKYPDKQVVWWDERFTSRMAQRSLIAGGVPKMARRNKGLIDTISATIILESFLESREYKDLTL
ncbi:MAG: Holliday junction resolvase RuvX [Alistipes sp.]|jgi:putative Holliday junction resolvase|nr:Holliday junction resolvase RuvX [Alistipes sp.]